MRFGCCLNMIAKGPDGTGIEYIEALAKAGFDYAELPLAEMMALPDGQFQELVRRVAGSGVHCEACNNFFPKTERLTGEARSGQKPGLRQAGHGPGRPAGGGADRLRQRWGEERPGGLPHGKGLRSGGRAAGAARPGGRSPGTSPFPSSRCARPSATSSIPFRKDADWPMTWGRTASGCWWITTI